ncbi:MAG: hypothetical protein RJQ01_05015 [Microcella sp.]|uniref:hypothetical protein n=1 Tax=Microcella sp. TaxID=1913979 RepID=UPI003315DC72
MTTTAPRTQRTAARTIHIVVGLLLGAIVYAPTAIGAVLLPIAQYVGVPAVVITGLFLWRQAWIRSWMRRRTASSSA